MSADFWWGFLTAYAVSLTLLIVIAAVVRVKGK